MTTDPSIADRKECENCKRLSGRKAECEIGEYDTTADDPRELWDSWEVPLNFCPECGRDMSKPDPNLCQNCEGCGYDIDEEEVCTECNGTGRKSDV